jgi:hypothetical protein
MERLACFEEGSNIVNFYNLEDGTMNELTLVVKPKPLEIKTTIVKKD